MDKQLALFGGSPVRDKQYPVHSTMIDSAEEREVLEVLRSGHLSGFSARPGERFLGGPKVKKLEKGFSEFFGVKHAVSFNSATSALHGIISAAKLGPGDEVIVPPTTMSATASSVIMQNAIPVFADIENKTYGLDPASVEKVITSSTKAILTVNLFGHPSQLDHLRNIADKHNLILLEDNSQAPAAIYNGKLAGTIGQMGVQSLNYHKGIQTGEGGIALTNDDDYARHLQLIRNHGEVVIGSLNDYSESDLINMVGWNYRLTELQAAVGIPQLKKLEMLNKERIQLAEKLSKGLAEFDFLGPPIVRENCCHVFYLFPIRYFQEKLGLLRSIFVKAMQAEGISISSGYIRPIYLEPMYQKKIAYGKFGCPFSCPMYDGSVTYDSGICPTAEKLYYEEIITTDICKYPNGDQETDEFVFAVKKIRDNAAELRERYSDRNI